MTPQVQHPRPRAVAWQIADVALLAVALGVAAWLALWRRQRGGLVAVSVVCLAYFGFYREGCICPIGATQNVAVALVDPRYAVPYYVIAIFVLPLAAALFFGRVFCAGVCPLGAIQELVALRAVAVPARLDKALGALKWVYLGLAVYYAVLPAVERDFLICRFDPFVGLFRFTGAAWLLMVGRRVPARGRLRRPALLPLAVPVRGAALRLLALRLAELLDHARPRARLRPVPGRLSLRRHRGAAGGAHGLLCLRPLLPLLPGSPRRGQGPPRGCARNAMTSGEQLKLVRRLGAASALVALVSVGVLVADHVVAAGRASAEKGRVLELEEQVKTDARDGGDAPRRAQAADRTLAGAGAPRSGPRLGPASVRRPRRRVGQVVPVASARAGAVPRGARGGAVPGAERSGRSGTQGRLALRHGRGCRARSSPSWTRSSSGSAAAGRRRSRSCRRSRATTATCPTRRCGASASGPRSLRPRSPARSSFYAQFRRSPVGRHVVRVCHGTACHVAGAEQISEELRRHLAIPPEGRHRPAPPLHARRRGLPRLLQPGPGDDDRGGHRGSAHPRERAPGASTPCADMSARAPARRDPRRPRLVRDRQRGPARARGGGAGGARGGSRRRQGGGLRRHVPPRAAARGGRRARPIGRLRPRHSGSRAGHRPPSPAAEGTADARSLDRWPRSATGARATGPPAPPRPRARSRRPRRPASCSRTAAASTR